MANELQGKKIAILVANEGVEQVELTEPRKALEDAGATIELISPEAGEVQALQPPRQGATRSRSTRPSRTRAPTDYDALLLPGGVANPDHLRIDEDAVAFIARSSTRASRSPRSATRPWTLVEADVVRGPHADVVAVAADRPPQRRRRPGSTRRSSSTQGLVDQPQARRPPGLQRQDDRGVRRGPARGPGPARGARRDRRQRAVSAARERPCARCRAPDRADTRPCLAPSGPARSASGSSPCP